MKHLSTMVDDAVFRQVCELAQQHTAGNVPAMLSMIIRHVAMGQEYDYAVMAEADLHARMVGEGRIEAKAGGDA